MPYQVGDKVVLADLAKNRLHHKMPRFMGQVLDVVEVLDRDHWDGNGDQNLRIEQIDRGLYNSGRFQLAAVPEAPPAAPARPFHVGQNVQTINMVWRVVEVRPEGQIHVEIVAFKNDFRMGVNIGFRNVVLEDQFTPVVLGDAGWQALQRQEAENANPIGAARNAGAIVGNGVNAIIIDDGIAKEQFNPGDVVVLTTDGERQGQGDIYFPELMRRWANAGREFVLGYKTGELWTVVDDDGYSFVYKEEWFDMAKAVLKVGDLLWYVEHTKAEGRQFIREEDRPVYYLDDIKKDGQILVKINEGAYLGSFAADLWMRKPGQKKAAAKKAEPVLDPKVQAEKLEKLIGECVAKFAANANGCANFYLISEKKNGELIKLGGTGMPCHYELRGGYGDGGKGVPVAVIDSIHRRREHLPKYKQQGFVDYVTYLLNRSPWADCYLAKDFEDAEKNGIRMNLDKTANQLVGACIAMRQSSEFDSVLPVHEFLKAKRFSGDVCFLVGQHYTMSQNGNITPICLNSGHTIMNNTMPADAVFKFFATKEFVGEDGKKPYRENKAYSNIFGSITGREEYARVKAGDVTIEAWMRKNCVAEQVGEGLGKKQVVTEASLLKLARAVKAELIKHKTKEEVAA